jgi:hypothetical protein
METSRKIDFMPPGYTSWNGSPGRIEKLAIVVPLVSGERQQTNMAGALDRTSQVALVLGAGTCLAARADFAFFSNKASKDIRLLVIDGHIFICAELTKFWAGVITSFTALFHIIIISLITFHTTFTPIYPGQRQPRECSVEAAAS